MLIWVVDDNGSLLEILEEVLAADYEVKTYDSGEELKRALANSGESAPGLLIIDWNLPGESTQQVLEEFMITYPQCRIAVMSGDLGSVGEWPHGVYRLEKPFKLKELQRWIRDGEKSLSTTAEMPF